MLTKVKYWIDKRRNPRKYIWEEERKKTRELAATMTEAIKPDYIDDQLFEDLKDSLAYSYIQYNRHNLDTLTTDAQQIYTFEISPRIYREAGMLKYIFKLATIDEFRLYLKMGVIADSNPKFCPSWCRDEHQRLIDALASGDINFAVKYAKENMRFLEPDFLASHPEVTWDCIMHMLFRSLVLQDLTTLQTWLLVLKSHINKLPNCYAVLPLIFESLIAGDVDILTSTLQKFVEDHDKIFKNNKFGETPNGDVIVNLRDKYLFIWAIAFLNFARHNGMDVSIEHYLVPKELLISIK